MLFFAWRVKEGMGWNPTNQKRLVKHKKAVSARSKNQKPESYLMKILYKVVLSRHIFLTVIKSSSI